MDNIYIKSRFYLVIFFLVLACQNQNLTKKKKDDGDIKINLKKKKEIGPFPTILDPFGMVPDSLISSFKGIPSLDTKSVQVLNLFSNRQLEQLVKNSMIDSTTYSSFNHQIHVFSAYEKGKQIMIVDRNRNKDFSDDDKLVFGLGLKSQMRDKISVKDSFPIINVSYKDYLHKKVVEKERFIRPIPYENYFDFKNPTEQEKTYGDLMIVSQVNEHMEGLFQIDSVDFIVFIQTFRNRSTLIIRQKEELYRNRTAEYIEKNTLGDTLELNSKFFRIDSLNYITNELFLKNLDIQSLNLGYKKGQIMNDFKFLSLSDGNMTLSELFKGKDYVLIDFWGTWCGPCKALTPRLKQIDSLSSKKMNILSIAYDAELEPVKEYISKNDMDWYHTYYKRNLKNRNTHPKLMNDLRVTIYPTFFLIDKNLNILYRGTGEKALEAIEEIVIADEVQ